MTLPDSVWFKQPWDMGPDREQSMVIEYKPKLAAKEAANLAKETFERLETTEPVTTLVTTATTVSKGTTSTATVEAAVVGGAVIVAEGTIKPAQGALATTIFGQLTLHKETNMTEQLKVANDL